jgi:hypothetical protein
MEDCFVLGDTKAKECGVVKIVCMCVCVDSRDPPLCKEGQRRPRQIKMKEKNILCVETQCYSFLFQAVKEF